LQKRRILGLTLILIFAISVNEPATADSAKSPTFPSVKSALKKSDISKAKSALKAIKVGKWKTANANIGKLRDPLAKKIFDWLAILDPKHDVGFAAARKFVEENPKWPNSFLLRRRAEESMGTRLSDDAVLEWFESRTPASSDGLMKLGSALLKTGQKEKAVELLRQTWRDGNFGRKQERQFYRSYRKHLTYKDHQERIDRLIWSDRYHPARRMLRYLKKHDRYLPEARLALMRKRGGVDRAISKIPSHQLKDLGFIYERLRWRRRKGRYLEARELLENLPDDLPYPNKWWRERSYLAREALKDGHITEALRLITNHGLREGAAFAEAEWLIGWINLRFLQEAEPALKHFNTMYEGVSYPISEARGAYWAGRAAEKLGKKKLAKDWYKAAANHPTTYYGQLSVKKLGKKADLNLPPQITPTTSEQAEFSKNELAGAIVRLKAMGLEDHLPTFIRALDRFRSTPGWRALTASLAMKVGRADQSVYVAKKVLQDGQGFVTEGYPLLKIPKKSPEAALVLAVIRQESRFSPTAKSHAGARGLMQIMPATARRVAKSIRVRYSKSKLLSDPKYNIRLGRHYLDGLVGKYDGTYLLALAAYNAGPHRVNRWIKEYGDPRKPQIDPIDWAEKIPFKETRNYVQRVLENLNVYRAKFGVTHLAYEDINRTGKTN